jgi:ABC-type sugar transport system ATPase subunit
MVGRDLGDLYHRTPREPGDVRLEVRDLVVPAPDGRGEPSVDGVSFDVRGGEVVALAGLLGSGRTETVMAVFGALPRRGQVIANGRELPAGRIDAAIAAGIALVTEDRKGSGLVLGLSARRNIGLANLDRVARRGILDTGLERAIARRQADDLALRPPQIERVAATFSGGNQQKIVLGKWLAREPNILLLDEPTRGVDVGAKAEIFALVDRLRSEGAAILMVSSDLLEVIGASDRILVLHEGRLEGELPARGATQEAIMAFATRTHEGAA